ncbi:unnamed protein product [Umbelopsis vinacea]
MIQQVLAGDKIDLDRHHGMEDHLLDKAGIVAVVDRYLENPRHREIAHLCLLRDDRNSIRDRPVLLHESTHDLSILSSLHHPELFMAIIVGHDRAKTTL